jgi:hypothetical protein
LLGLGEADASAHEQRLDGRHRHLERVGHVGVGHPSQLAHKQGGTLLIGESLNVGQQASEGFTLLGLGGRVLDGRAHELDQFRRWRGRPAQLVDAAVVGDPVQPRAQGELAIVGPQSRVCAHEHVLEGILGILVGARQHLAGVGEEPGAVAVVDHPEGVVVALPEQRHKLLVRSQSEQPT